MSSKKRNSTLLVADDDSVVLKLIAYHFEQAGLYCDLFASGDELLDAAGDETQACLLDLEMPGKSGLDCLKYLKKEYPNVEVVILTNVNQAAEALDAVRSGAFDYITKPFDPDELVRIIRKAMLMSRQQKENVELRHSIVEPHAYVDLLGDSKAMQRIKSMVMRIGPSENSVLLTGESGTGKTLLARVLHANSSRKDGPFVSVSCPSLPGELLESEMFGHEKGAFSGATQRRLGRAELASGGTLFLDEIGEMPLRLQAKLLTFLQEKSFYRVGGEKLLVSDLRIIAATNQNLGDMVKEGRFREDLYFRLNVLPLEMPALRHRLSDIPMLVDYFLERAMSLDTKAIPVISDGVFERLRAYDWPGNIRELENVVIRSCTLRQNEEKLIPEDFALGSGDPVGQGHCSDDVDTKRIVGLTLAEVEKLAIEQTLELCQNNKSEAARILGIAEKSIYNKLKKHGLGEAKEH